MKLIRCTLCTDIVGLVPNLMRACYCGQSVGGYVDNVRVEVSGPCQVWGMNNLDLADAETLRQIDAWIITEPNPKIKRAL